MLKRFAFIILLVGTMYDAYLMSIYWYNHKTSAYDISFYKRDLPEVSKWIARSTIYYDCEKEWGRRLAIDLSIITILTIDLIHSKKRSRNKPGTVHGDYE